MNENINFAPYDLHLHSHWSYDAEANIDALFKGACERGIRCIAITEHHVLDSVIECRRVAANFPEINYVPSAELTVTTSIGSVDLLCYGFPETISEELQSVLDEYHQWQRDYGAALCRGMQEVGCNYTDEHRMEVLESYRPAHVIEVQGYTHVKNGIQRRYFIERGFIDSEGDYVTLLSAVRAKVPLPPYPRVERVVPAVKNAGSLVVIAHPVGYFKDADINRMDALRNECQLDGIECAHPGVPPEMTANYRDYCLKHKLISTGGSDCHSDGDIQRLMGKHGGPAEWLDELIAALRT